MYLLIFTDSFFNISTLILVPIYAVYVLSLGGDVRHIGELYAVYAVTFGIVGWVATRNFLHRRSSIAVSYLLWTAYSFVLIFNHSLTTFYCLQVVAGCAAAIRHPFLEQSISDHSQPGRVQFYKTFYQFLGHMGAAVISIIAAHLAHHKGFEIVFIMMSCLGSVAFLFGLYYVLHLKKHALLPNQGANNAKT